MNKKTMKIAGWALGLSLAVAGIGAAIGTSAKGAVETKATLSEDPVYTLNCPKSTTNSSYSKYYDVEVDGITWNAPGNQLNNGDWRIGRAKDTSITAADKTIYSKNPIPENVGQISVTYGAQANTITVNSATVFVYDTAAKAAAGTSGTEYDSKSFDYAASSTKTITPSAGKSWEGMYYRFVFNLTSAKTSRAAAISLSSLEFYELLPTYTLTYDANGGSGTMTDSNSPYDRGSTVTVLASTFTAPEGMMFDHWDTKADDSGTDYSVGDTFSISANTTLFAQWEAAGSVCTVTGTIVNGSLSSLANVPLNDSLDITLNPSAHYHLPTSLTSVTMGGNALTAGVGYTYNNSTGAIHIETVTGDVVINATCIEDSKYTVTYVAGDGGTGNNFVVADQYAGAYTLLPLANTGLSANSGYGFEAYSVGGVRKNPGETITLAANTTVTALFTRKYDVVFGTADGTASLSGFTNTSYSIPSGVTLGNIQGYIYGKNDNTSSAIRFGKGGEVGSFDATISEGYYIKSVIANLKYYGSDTTAVFAVTPSGGSAIEKTLTGSFADYAFDVASSYVRTVTLGTTVSGERAYLSGFSLVYDKTWTQNFLDTFTCSGVTVGNPNGAITVENPEDVWADMAEAFSSLPSSLRASLKTLAAGNETINARAMERYDLVIRKYGKATYNDFIGRFEADGANPSGLGSMLGIRNQAGGALPLVVTVAALGTAAAAGFFIFQRKHKEN